MSSNFPPEYATKQEFLQDLESLGGPNVVSFTTLIQTYGEKPLYNDGEERLGQLMFMLDYVKSCPFSEYMLMLEHFNIQWSEQTQQRRRLLMMAMLSQEAL